MDQGEENPPAPRLAAQDDHRAQVITRTINSQVGQSPAFALENKTDNTGSQQVGRAGIFILESRIQGIVDDGSGKMDISGSGAQADGGDGDTGPVNEGQGTG
ncbi:hypothetical protein [Neomoorella glycerini]|uniref:hypothetical protein n=1 Tax=Neomoorella glycerini TaxID=55779 RepID=UPI0012E22DA8|nr:hypothetical protein [Moorella glycerini]